MQCDVSDEECSDDTAIRRTGERPKAEAELKKRDRYLRVAAAAVDIAPVWMMRPNSPLSPGI